MANGEEEEKKKASNKKRVGRGGEGSNKKIEEEEKKRRLNAENTVLRETKKGCGGVACIFFLLFLPVCPLLRYALSSVMPFTLPIPLRVQLKAPHKAPPQKITCSSSCVGGGVKNLPVQAGGVVLGPSCFQLLLLRGTHSLRVCVGGKEKGLPAHGEINAFFSQKTTFLEISCMWRGEIFHLRLTIVSKGAKISTGKFLQFLLVVVPLLVFPSHSRLKFYRPESLMTKTDIIRAYLSKFAGMNVGRVKSERLRGT